MKKQKIKTAIQNLDSIKNQAKEDLKDYKIWLLALFLFLVFF